MASGATGSDRRSLLERMQAAADADEQRFLQQQQEREQQTRQATEKMADGGTPEEKRPL